MGVVPVLTVAQYASLRAELAVRPEIMGRYGVGSAAVWKALEEHWERVFAGRAGDRAVFERAYGAYVEFPRFR